MWGLIPLLKLLHSLLCVLLNNLGFLMSLSLFKQNKTFVTDELPVFLKVILPVTVKTVA